MTEKPATSPRNNLNPLLFTHEVQQNPPDVERAVAEWSRAVDARNVLKNILDEGGTTRDALEYLKTRYKLKTDAAIYNLWKRYVRQAKRELGVAS